MLKKTLKYSACILVAEGVLMLGCHLASVWFSEKSYTFLILGLTYMVLALLIFKINSSYNKESRHQKNSVIMFATWLVMIIGGMAPYLLYNSFSNIADLVFETISGFTSTGSTVLALPESLPKSLLLWRSMTQWIGSAVSVIMVVYLLTKYAHAGNDIFILKSSKILSQKCSESRIFKRFILAYFLLTIIQILLLKLTGTGFFNSIIFSLGSVSSSSFAPDSNGAYQLSAASKVVFIFFMILSGMNYLVLAQIFSGKVKSGLKDEEFRLYIKTAVFTTAVFVFTIDYKLTDTLLIDKVFQAVSVISSSGYNSIQYMSWPGYIVILIMFLIFTGSCTSSGGGGIKYGRVLILFKNFRKQLVSHENESNVANIRYNNVLLWRDTNLSILNLIIIFGLLFIFGTLVIAFITSDVKTSVFLSLTALSNFGYSENLAQSPESVKIVMSILMIAGKFEIYPLIILFAESINKHQAGKI